LKPSLPMGRTGQLLALGLTALGLAALWLGIASPLIAWHGERAEALTERVELARRMAALVAAVPTLQQQVATVAAGGAGNPALLDGDSDSTASAALQERLQVIFMQAGVPLNSVETLPGEAAGAYRRIRLRVSFNAAWPALMVLLREMHVATPVLLMDELQVQSVRHLIAPEQITFDVSCSVFGFRSGIIRTSAR
jgi:hypothetical protein